MADNDDDARRQAYMAVGDSMRVHTERAIAAIYGIESATRGKLVGSGTFIRPNGATYLLTAEHVAREIVRNERLAHSVSYGARPEIIRNPVLCYDLPLDIAMVRIEDDVVFQHGLQPWPATILAETAGDVSRDILFIHGYPSTDSHWLPIVNGGIHSESMPFLTSDATATWRDFDPDLHIAVIYPRDGWFDKNGAPISMPVPDCLSGSALWQTHRRDHAMGWSPEKARIIGIIHRYDEGGALIATRIEPIRAFILKMLEREAASPNG